jgi:asparagine N-glycosylation enzyme membrane subunit Stt3
MIGMSLVLICDRILNFYIYRMLEGNVPLVNSDSINLQVVSGIAFLGFSIVPLVLAIGLWNLKSWARFLSISFFSAVMLPASAASLKWISPPSADKLLQIPVVFDDVLSVSETATASRLVILNPYIAIGSAIALVILLTPAIGKVFRNRSPQG